MRFSINVYARIKNILLFLFIFTCLVFPAADLIISKKLLFACNIVTVGLDCCLFKKKLCTRNIFLRVIFLFVTVIIFSIPTYIWYPAEVQFLIFSCVTVFIVLSLYNKEYLAFEYFIVSLNILALATVIIGLLTLYSKVFVVAVNAVFLSLNSGYLGKRNFAGLELIMVHFRTAPIMIISVSYYFIKTIHSLKIKNILLLLLQVTAIIFSASRGTMLFSFVSFFCILFRDYKNSFSRKLLFCFIIAGFLGGLFLLKNTSVFSRNEESNSIKHGHIESFVEYIDENPMVLLWGAGTGSFYYSKGFGKMTYQTEITYLDMIRYFGIFFTFLFIFVMGFPARKNVMNIPFLAYFLDAATNPLIFCSTGMLAIALYYSLPKFDANMVPLVCNK